MNDKQQENVPLGTYISPGHRAKLDRMKRAGLRINAVVEQGIDLVYEQMLKARVVAPALEIRD